jgi:hypothetical protein
MAKNFSCLWAAEKARKALKTLGYSVMDKRTGVTELKFIEIFSFLGLAILRDLL